MTHLLKGMFSKKDSDENEKDKFYNQFQDILNSVMKGDISLLPGDSSAKVGTDSNLWAGVLGPFGIGSSNDNGEHLLQVCASGKFGYRLWIEKNARSFTTGTQCFAAEVTKPAPDFKGMAVVDSNFKEIKLSDYNGKYVVLLFYPLDFTFVCPTEIIAFSERASDFRALNTEVIAASTDSHFSHLAWTNTSRKDGGLGKVNIPLLSDFNKNISRDYGVLLETPGIALRGLFIIDPKSIVRQITVNDLPVGRCVDETLRLIKAFQFVEKHGEVCPAGWQPDSPSIKPDPVRSKEYFEKVN